MPDVLELIVLLKFVFEKMVAVSWPYQLFQHDFFDEQDNKGMFGTMLKMMRAWTGSALSSLISGAMKPRVCVKHVCNVPDVRHNHSQIWPCC